MSFTQEEINCLSDFKIIGLAEFYRTLQDEHSFNKLFTSLIERYYFDFFKKNNIQSALWPFLNACELANIFPNAKFLYPSSKFKPNTGSLFCFLPEGTPRDFSKCNFLRVKLLYTSRDQKIFVYESLYEYYNNTGKIYIIYTDPKEFIRLPSCRVFYSIENNIVKFDISNYSNTSIYSYKYYELFDIIKLNNIKPITFKDMIFEDSNFYKSMYIFKGMGLEFKNFISYTRILANISCLESMRNDYYDELYIYWESLNDPCS